MHINNFKKIEIKLASLAKNWEVINWQNLINNSIKNKFN